MNVSRQNNHFVCSFVHILYIHAEDDGWKLHESYYYLVIHNNQLIISQIGIEYRQY